MVLHLLSYLPLYLYLYLYSTHRNLYNRVLASVRAGNFSIRKLKSTITFDGKGIFTIGKKLLVDKNLEWALQ